MDPKTSKLINSIIGGKNELSNRLNRQNYWELTTITMKVQNQGQFTNLFRNDFCCYGDYCDVDNAPTNKRRHNAYVR